LISGTPPCKNILLSTLYTVFWTTMGADLS
jgi:hypothetical protein